MDGLVFLVVCGLYVYLAKVVAQFIRRRTESTLAQYATIVVFVLIPTWDIIPGWLYFQHLCETEAGVKVGKIVEVDRSNFKSDGQPDEEKLAELYAQTTKFDKKFSAIFNIARTETTVFDSQTNEILAVGKNFSRHGGWLNQLILPDATGTSCPAYPYFGMHGITLQQAFRPRAEPHN
jgi:hypothetical protein